MARGIGVRYGENGLRAVTVERSGGRYLVSDVAAGPWTGDVHSFLTEHGFPADETPVAVGLGPGSFLSAFLTRENGMDEMDMEDLLRWELGRKILAHTGDYSFGFALENQTAFLFATPRLIVEKLCRDETSRTFVDVEPSALSNACGCVEDSCEDPMIVISVEAEGVSAIALDNGVPVAVESFSARREEWIDRLPGLDFIGNEAHDPDAALQFGKYASGSVNRIVSRLAGRWKPARIVLTGGGVYMGDVASHISEKTGFQVSIMNPLTSDRVKVSFVSPRIMGLGAAFTICFGLAIRAIEE